MSDTLGSTALFDLITCDFIQASHVINNSLTFDYFLAEHLRCPPASIDADDKRRTQSLKQLRTRLERVIAMGEAQLEPRPLPSFNDRIDERYRLGKELSELLPIAGIVHDNLNATAAMSSPDMPQGWRRFEVIDQHASRCLTELGDHVAKTSLRLCQKPPPEVDPKILIDFRHVQWMRNFGQSTEPSEDPAYPLYHLGMPLWLIHLPRYGAGLIAHECAHPAAAKLLDQFRDQPKVAESIDYIKTELLPHFTKTRPNRDEAERAKVMGENTDLFLREVLTDVLAASILGPAYLVNLAESLLSSGYLNPVSGVLRHTPLVVRLEVLLELHRIGAFPDPRQIAPTKLIGAVQATIEEYQRASNRDARFVVWLEFQTRLAEQISPAVAVVLGAIGDQLARDTQPPLPYVEAYRECWQGVEKLALEFEGRELREGLQKQREVELFFRKSETSNKPNTTAAARPACTIERGEVWSLDRVWLRTTETKEPDRKAVPLGPLLEWLMRLTDSVQPEPDSIHALTLGDADAMVLRPNFRLRRPTGLSLDEGDPLRPYIERRTLFEINAIHVEGRDAWRPKPLAGNEPCLLANIRLKRDARPEHFMAEFFSDEDQLAEDELIRAFVTLGWAKVMLLLRPRTAKRWLDTKGEKVLAQRLETVDRSVTSVISSLQLTDSRHIEPWAHYAPNNDEGEKSPAEYVDIASLLRLREGQIHQLLEKEEIESGKPLPDWPHVKLLSLEPLYGREDYLMRFQVRADRVADVTRFLYWAQSGLNISRSHSLTIAAPPGGRGA